MEESKLLHFAKHMTELRKRHKWSQPELGEKIGSAGSVIGRYERCEIKPSLEVALKITEALGTTLDYMTHPETLKNPLKEKDAQNRIRSLTLLPEKDQECIFYLIDGLIRDAKSRLTYG